MVSYREPPGDPDALLVVVATPEEVHALRPSIRARLYRVRVPSKDIDDLCQDVEIVTWRALDKGRVRGAPTMSPGDALLGFVLMVARTLGENFTMLARNRREWLARPIDQRPEGQGDERAAILEPADPHDLEAQIEARDLLRRIAPHHAATVLLRSALEEPLSERARDEGVVRSAESSRLTRSRRWLRDLAESGVWREPPQPRKACPRHRKRGR